LNFILLPAIYLHQVPEPIFHQAYQSACRKLQTQRTAPYLTFNILYANKSLISKQHPFDVRAFLMRIRLP
jgi:hypothetical protein